MIDELATNGITPEELARAKTRMIADAVYAQDNQATLARWYGAALATGSTVDDVKSWTEQVRAVTADRCACGRPDLARQAPLRDRLSDQGMAQARGEEILIAWRACSLRIATASALALALTVPASAATEIERDRQSARHRSLAGAFADRAVDRHRFCVSRRLQPGSGRQGRCRRDGGGADRRGRRRSRRARVPRATRSRMRSA